MEKIHQGQMLKNSMVTGLHPHWLYAKVLEKIVVTQLSEVKRLG